MVSGMNSTPAGVLKIAAIAEQIGPDRIQLNTAVRPPAEDFAAALSRERLETLTGLFRPRAEVIAEFEAKHSDHTRVNQETILALLQRRPCTPYEIADTFGMHFNEVSKYLGKLLRTDQIRAERRNTSVYYAISNR